MKTTKLSNGYRIYLTNEEFRTLNYLTSIGYGDTQKELKAGSRSIPKVVVDNLESFKAPSLTVDRIVSKDKGYFDAIKGSLQSFWDKQPSIQGSLALFGAGAIIGHSASFIFF